MRFDTPYNQRTTPPHHGAPGSAPSPAPSGSRTWNTWWSRRSPNINTNDKPPVRIGIDAGSKTLKIVALDEDGCVVFAEYHRHRSDVRTSLLELIHSVIWRYGDPEVPVAVTGSAGIALADALGVPFVQEVVAATNAVRARYPHADCMIELGGEDAKITYLTGTPEYRMNATCAGGTGDFIDGIASMLGCKTREISKLALGHQRTYPIASRCAVFAQTDVRPLINAGARPADIAQSALEAVVRQTLGGLACGRPIRGTVVFLGGPLEHIPALVMAFRRKLGLNAETGIKPPDAHLFTAMGAIETAIDAPAVALSELERRAFNLTAQAKPFPTLGGKVGYLEPLFASDAEREEFLKRHRADIIPTKRLENTEGPLFLGFDAGSTTCKYALVDETGTLVLSDYRDVKGETLDTARAMMEELLAAVEGGTYSRRRRFIARAVVTGYGESLLRIGLGFDAGVVETVAHLRAAQRFRPDASFVLDIGGQDMKALWVRDGQVVDAVLNEACSSGCGAFVRSSAKSLNLSHDDFSREALSARRPINLGAKCTVFMTSRVRHAQKTGAAVGDIAAGIAYSVVNNTLTRIIGSDRATTMGEVVVVQGGTFKSDAVLRAFEKVTGTHAIRPNAAHLMGAYGCALIAADDWSAARDSDSPHKTDVVSSLLDVNAVRAMRPIRSSMRCTGCGNSCLLSVVDFGSGRRHMTGNRCERASEAMFGSPVERKASSPNVVAHEQRLIASFRSVRATGSRAAVKVGLMNALHMYENTPFWHTLLARLGFSIIMPDDRRAARYQDEAAESIPSESACHPAKICHLRYADLTHAGADIVFMPRFARRIHCPVSCQYADAVAGNADGAPLACPTLSSFRPAGLAGSPSDRDALLSEFNSWLEGDAIGPDEFGKAFEEALQAQSAFEREIATAAAEARAWTSADPTRRLAIIAGRPYHDDEALLHGIDRELANLGFAVIPASACAPAVSGAEKPLWKPSKQLVRLVRAVADDPQAEVVVLRSFGCSYDAVSCDEARDVALSLHRPFTELKIDDIADTAHIRIRLRTLAYTSGRQPLPRDTPKASHAPDSPAVPVKASGTVTPDLCSTAKALVLRACDELEEHPGIDDLVVPNVCKDCLTDALPFELAHILNRTPRVSKRPADGTPERTGAGLKVGLLGNPLLVFNPALNDHVEDLLKELGCEVIYPARELIEVEDVRYLDQLRAFEQAGVERVIYLQSFGCLKGHMQSRGALRELSRLFPGISITVVDYDPESSALNRENRIRLAVSNT